MTGPSYDKVAARYLAEIGDELAGKRAGNPVGRCFVRAGRALSNPTLSVRAAAAEQGQGLVAERAVAFA